MSDRPTYTVLRNDETKKRTRKTRLWSGTNVENLVDHVTGSRYLLIKVVIITLRLRRFSEGRGT